MLSGAGSIRYIEALVSRRKRKRKDTPEEVLTCKLAERAGLFPRFPDSGDLTSLFPFGLGIRVGEGEVGGEGIGKL